ncbi:MAG: hypothetical protein IPK57_14220 [Chitinophagaceae bacterium]|nr:hypothetical protein [Chitinophagaceae bacterium]
MDQPVADVDYHPDNQLYREHQTNHRCRNQCCVVQSCVNGSDCTVLLKSLAGANASKATDRIA